MKNNYISNIFSVRISTERDQTVRYNLNKLYDALITYINGISYYKIRLSVVHLSGYISTNATGLSSAFTDSISNMTLEFTTTFSMTSNVPLDSYRLMMKTDGSHRLLETTIHSDGSVQYTDHTLTNVSIVYNWYIYGETLHRI